MADYEGLFLNELEDISTVGGLQDAQEVHVSHFSDPLHDDFKTNVGDLKADFKSTNAPLLVLGGIHRASASQGFVGVINVWQELTTALTLQTDIVNTVLGASGYRLQVDTSGVASGSQNFAVQVTATISIEAVDPQDQFIVSFMRDGVVASGYSEIIIELPINASPLPITISDTFLLLDLEEISVAVKPLQSGNFNIFSTSITISGQESN
jgi:hypothetical protein